MNAYVDVCLAFFYIAGRGLVPAIVCARKMTRARVADFFVVLLTFFYMFDFFGFLCYNTMQGKGSKGAKEGLK